MNRCNIAPILGCQTQWVLVADHSMVHGQDGLLANHYTAMSLHLLSLHSDVATLIVATPIVPTQRCRYTAMSLLSLHLLSLHLLSLHNDVTIYIIAALIVATLKCYYTYCRYTTMSLHILSLHLLSLHSDVTTYPITTLIVATPKCCYTHCRTLRVYQTILWFICYLLQRRWLTINPHFAIIASCNDRAHNQPTCRHHRLVS